MNPLSQLRPDRSAPRAEEPSPPSRPEAIGAGTGQSPPHMLWQTLESAYATVDKGPAASGDRPHAPQFAVPMGVGLSVVLWVIILELVMLLH